MGAELFFADRQTDRHDEASLFSQFCERPEATSRRYVPLVQMQHRASTSPLQIMLFCKHLPATQPTHLSVGTLGIFVQPVPHSTAGRHRNLGSLAFNLGCCEKQTLRSPVRILRRMHRPRFCSFSTQSRTRATRFIYSKNTQRFISVHHSDHRPLWLQSFRHSSVYTAHYMMFSRDCRLIHKANYNSHSLQLTSQMFVFQ